MITKNQFGVIYMLTIFTCLWGLYLFLFKDPNPNKKYTLGECLFNYIYPIPMINRNRQLDYEQCLDGWSVNHFVIYMITGMFFPHEYLLVFGLSLLCEVLEILGRSRGRLSDIIVNSLGYLLGSFLSSYVGIKIIVDNDAMPMIIPCALLVSMVFLKISKKRYAELNKIKLPTWKE